MTKRAKFMTLCTITLTTIIPSDLCLNPLALLTMMEEISDFALRPLRLSTRPIHGPYTLPLHDAFVLSMHLLVILLVLLYLISQASRAIFLDVLVACHFISHF